MKLAYPRRQRQLETLVRKLGLSQEEPIKWDLLDLALTHPSVSDSENYEQLDRQRTHNNTIIQRHMPPAQ